MKIVEKKRLLGLGLVVVLVVGFYLYQTSTQTKDTTSDINATMINIYGKTDKRLMLRFVSFYRSVSDSSNSDCKTYTDYNTGSKRVVPVVTSIYVENQDEYNVTIPIYNRDTQSRCQYEFMSLSLEVARLYERDGLYAKVPIIARRPQFIGEGWDGGFSRYHKPLHSKKYFRMPNGKKVSCYTVFHKKGRMIKHDTTEFICDFDFRDKTEGVEEIEDDSIHLDIVVDEERCRYLFKERHISIYHYKKGNMTPEEMKMYDAKQKKFEMPMTLIHIKLKHLIEDYISKSN